MVLYHRFNVIEYILFLCKKNCKKISLFFQILSETEIFFIISYIFWEKSTIPFFLYINPQVIQIRHFSTPSYTYILQNRRNINSDGLILIMTLC